MNRASRPITVSVSVTGSAEMDTLLLMGTGLLSGAMLFWHATAKTWGFSARTFFGSVFIVGICVEAVALARWLTYPFFYSPIYSNVTWLYAELADQLLRTLGLLSPLLILLVLLSWLVRVAVTSVRSLRGWPAGQEQLDQYLAAEKPSPPSYLAPLLLGATLLIILVAAVFPYIPRINPTGFPIGADIPHYADSINGLLGATSRSQWMKLLLSVYYPDRPLFLAILEGGYKLTGGNLVSYLEVVPAVEAFLLALSSFWFVSTWKRDKTVAAFCSFFLLFSYHFLPGLYGGFLANWFALFLAYVSLALLVRLWRKPNFLDSFALLVAMSAMLLSHPYTWVYALSIVVGFVALNLYRRDTKEGRQGIRAFAILFPAAAPFALDVIRNVLFGNFAIAYAANLLVGSNLSLTNFAARWQSLGINFNYILGGYYTNPVLLLLALYWVVALYKGDSGARLLLVAFSVAAVPALFGDYLLQYRIFLDLPLQIPAALATMSIWKRADERWPGVGTLFVVFVVLVEMTYLFNGIANLVPLA